MFYVSWSKENKNTWLFSFLSFSYYYTCLAGTSPIGEILERLQEIKITNGGVSSNWLKMENGKPIGANWLKQSHFILDNLFSALTLMKKASLISS